MRVNAERKRCAQFSLLSLRVQMGSMLRGPSARASWKRRYQHQSGGVEERKGERVCVKVEDEVENCQCQLQLLKVKCIASSWSPTNSGTPVPPLAHPHAPRQVDDTELPEDPAADALMRLETSQGVPRAPSLLLLRHSLLCQSRGRARPGSHWPTTFRGRGRFVGPMGRPAGRAGNGGGRPGVHWSVGVVIVVWASPYRRVVLSRQARRQHGWGSGRAQS